MARKINFPEKFLLEYVDHILADYENWCGQARINYKLRFDVTYEIGNNYIKIIHNNGVQRSVHSFIVNKATKGFQVGDILKAASWAAPATNFKRGTVLDPETYTNRVRWTGAI